MKPKTRVLALATGMAALVTLGVLAARWLYTSHDPSLCSALGKGRIVRIYAADVRVGCDAVDQQPLARAAFRELALADDPQALAHAMAAEKGVAVALDPSRPYPGLLGRLAGFAYVPGLSTLALGPELLLFKAEPEPALSPKERDAVAYVARAILRGAREPRVSSFPRALRKVERVEVMVSLLHDGRPLLWRSARGTSIARALLTATRVARERWHEREQAMGGPLRERLPELDVEVALLREDGTLLRVEKPFVDRVVTDQHGIGYDYRNGWHYVLPAAIAKRGGSAYAALSDLLQGQGSSTVVLHQSDARVYRFVPLHVGASTAPLAAIE